MFIFCSLPDIPENVLLDIRKNLEWPRFLAHPEYLQFVANYLLINLRKYVNLSELYLQFIPQRMQHSTVIYNIKTIIANNKYHHDHIVTSKQHI